jgi:hypothetical protein
MSKTNNEERKSAFQLAIEARNAEEKLVEFDLTDVFGVGGRSIPKVAIRVPTKRDQDRAIKNAYVYVAEVAEGVEPVKTDRDVVQDAKAACIAAEFARDPADGGKYPLFTPMWAAANLRPEEIAVFVNLSNAVRAERQGLSARVTDESVEEWIKIVDGAASTEVPAAVLAGCAREYLEYLVIAMALKVVAARDALAEGQPPVPPSPAPEPPAEC